MPRRIPDYPDSFAGWNLVSSYGSIISVIASALFVYILIKSFSDGSREENNNNWRLPQYNTSDKIFINNSPSGESIDFVLTTPIELHAFNVIPLMTIKGGDEDFNGSREDISGRREVKLTQA